MKDFKKLISDLSSDSKKKSEASANELTILARKHIDKLSDISHKYGKQYKSNSDYQTGKGEFSFEEIDNDDLIFLYTDSWSYGGSCHEYIRVKISDLDGFDYAKFEKEQKTKAINDLTNNIHIHEMQIKGLREKLIKIEAL